ncbi:MAG: tyrosine-type recombinase/integrase [Anaerolineales bacterium]|nr:tyrosine-type recombinase/integrase [Anaerolineales bacterium]
MTTLTGPTHKIVPHSSLSAPVPFDATLLAGQLAPSSIAMYQRDFTAYAAFAGDLAALLDAATLARWRTHLAQETEMSPNTINRMLSAVKRLMREAAAQGYIPHAAADAFKDVSGVKAVALKERIKDNARVRIEPTAMRTICDAPQPERLIGVRDTALLNTLASSGLRVSEVAGLKRQQIRAKGAGYVILVRGKNDVEYREAPLSREAYSHITAWLEERPVHSDYIFTAFDGRGERVTARPISSVAIWRVARKYTDTAGLTDVKPHDFRRFVGTQLARSNLRMAQKALGHKRLETTARHYILDELEAGLTDDLY